MKPWTKDWTLAGTFIALLMVGCAGDMGSGQSLSQSNAELSVDNPDNRANRSNTSKPADNSIKIIPEQPPTSPSSESDGSSQGFQLQVLALEFASNYPGSALADNMPHIQRVTKPEKGAHVFMGCDGRAWAYLDASQSIYELNAASTMVNSGKAYCTFQVANGRFWSLTKSGASTKISFGLAGADQTLQATYTTTDLKIPAGVETKNLADDILPLSVNTQNVVFSFGNTIQYYELVQRFRSNGQTESSVAMTTIAWDLTENGAPISAGRLERGYWVATKTHLHWLKPVHDKKSNITGHTWKSQSLTFEEYTPKELASLDIKGIGLFVTEGAGRLVMHGRASLLLPNSISVSSDLQWKETIKPLAETACAGCHSTSSGRPWSTALSRPSWLGNWKAVLEEKIKLPLHPQFSAGAQSLTAEQKMLIIDWLEAAETSLTGTFLDQAPPQEDPEAEPPADSQPPQQSSAEERWEMEVKPILMTSCLTSGCHSSPSGTQIGTYESFQQTIDVVRGSLTDEPGVMQMPMGNPDALSLSDRNVILNYIDDFLLEKDPL